MQNRALYLSYGALASFVPSHLQNCQLIHLNTKYYLNTEAILEDNMLRQLNVLAEYIVFAPDLELKHENACLDTLCTTHSLPLYNMLRMNLCISNIYNLKQLYNIYIALNHFQHT